NQQQNKKKNPGRAYTARSGKKKPYVGQKPTCFKCEAQGHFKMDCPKLKNNIRGNQARNGNAPVKVYAVGHVGNPDSNIVTGTFLLRNRYASILFDTGADRSFVSTTFNSQIDITPTTLDHYYDVEVAVGKIIRLNTIIREQDKIAQALEITKLKQRVKKLERRNKLKVSKLMRLKKVGTAQRVDTFDDTVMDDVSKQGRIIVDMDVDVDVTLKDIAKDVVVDAEIEENADDDDIEPAELLEVVEVVTTAKLITKVVTTTSAIITAAAPRLTTAAALTLTTAPSAARRRKGVVIIDPEETATPSTIIHTEAKSKDKGKGILVEEPKPLKKQAQIEQDEGYARESEENLNKNIDWDEVIDQVQRKEKENNAVIRYQALKRKPQTEAQAKKNMMIYLRNMAGFKMDYFKGMEYDDIRLIFEKYFNSNRVRGKANKNIDWDEVIDQVQRKKKEDNAVIRYQALKRKPQTEAQAKKNMMIYLKNMAGFKMDYFKGMKYDDIHPIFKKYFNSNVAFLENTKEQIEEEDSRALKKISETQKVKAAKKQKLDEEVAELKRHLQIVPNDDDDIYTEATPLARKVPIVDYEIYTENNKPYYKIIRADGSP
nr:hypothetical protein [Tanacetum cinerariifolium]